jgi:beta-glucosidase
LGYTWFPLFTMVDWRYRLSQRPLTKHYIELGLYTLAPPGAPSRWQPTALAADFAAHVQEPETAVGHLGV